MAREGVERPGVAELVWPRGRGGMHVALELSCVLWRPSRCEALARKHTTSSSYLDLFGLECVLRKAHRA